MKHQISFWILIIVLAVVLFSCQTLVEEPAIKTGTASNVTSNSAVVTGTIIDAGEGIDNYGFCWSVSPNPTINNFKNNIGQANKTEEYSSKLTNLNAGTLYYIKAYAISGNSEIYGEVLSFTTDPEIVTDVDGTVYNVVRIGTQLWMKENLRTTKYNDNSGIPPVTDNITWRNLLTPGYCWYNNDATTYGNTYGALYNWYAVNSGKLCPVGWHVPGDAEWTTLINYLGGGSLAGGKMKEQGTTHWKTPNAGATNESLFTGLPGAYHDEAGNFGVIGEYGFWWSGTEISSTNSWDRGLRYETNEIRSGQGYKKVGMSVRCIKN